MQKRLGDYLKTKFFPGAAADFVIAISSIGSILYAK